MTIKEYVAYRKEEIKAIIASKEVKPSLTIVQVNDDPASNAYVKGKLKDGTELGANVNLIKLPTTTEPELLDLIDKLNNDSSVDGFIVQMPLPNGIDEEKVKLAVSPSKDVDGFHPLSSLYPCTPLGILNYLKHEGIDFKGKNAVVIGRSNIVGKPMAKILLAQNCNVTVLHSKTTPEDMRFYVKHADIIVIAIGRAGFLDKSFEYKDSAVVVDVGITRTDEGLKGDAEKDLAVRIQTPVPGGVGLLTRLALFENLLLLTK